MIDDSRRIIEVNDIFCTLHGTTREKALGRPAHAFLTAESRRLALAAIASGSTEPYEVTAVREDGSTFPIEARGHTLSYQGRTMRVATLRDLSERKTAEEALRRSENRYRSLVQAAATFVWTLSAEGDIPRPQPAWSTWSDYTGQTPQQYLGRGWMDADSSRRPAGDFRSGRWDATRTGSVFQAEGRVRRHDGVYRHFLIRGAPVKDHDNRLVEWVAATSTSRPRRRRKPALGTARNGSGAMLTQVSTCSGWPTPKRVPRVPLARLRASLGRSRASVMQNPRRWKSIFIPEDARAPELDGRHAQGERREVEYRIIRRDGTMRWIRDTAFPILGPEGRVRRMAGLARDVTRLKQTEDRQKLLLGELNHRVKNTLATVQSIARHTLRSVSSPEVLHERFEDRLLALSKTHNLLTSENWEHASLRELLEQELSPYGAGRYHLRGGEDVRLAPRAVVALGMALHELTTNAAKYGALSTEAGTVTLRWAIVGAPNSAPSYRWSEVGGPPVTSCRRAGASDHASSRGACPPNSAAWWRWNSLPRASKH